jgi:thiamine kinase-like enzyme
MHALRRDDYPRCHCFEAWFHWFDFTAYLAELHDFLDEYGPWLETTKPDGRDLRDRLGHLVEECAEVFASTCVDPGRGRFPLCLCRVDANLANAIWDRDGRLRWVDWEYSGWGDPALDLAELRWHAALAGLGEAQHTWLRDTYRRPDDDPGFDERIAVWDRLLATRWPFLTLRWLWSEHNGPDRMRLTRMRVDPAEMRARLVRFIERAERLEST